jgi:hypothetical protein
MDIKKPSKKSKTNMVMFLTIAIDKVIAYIQS